MPGFPYRNGATNFEGYEGIESADLEELGAKKFKEVVVCMLFYDYAIIIS